MHSKPQPCFMVPYKKDPMFVGRKAIIGAIKERHEAIGQRHERVALVGLAGVGKTQTAIEYSYHVRETTQRTWVFWIHASNAARLEQGYQQIATVAEIPGRHDPKMNILHLVYQWLCDTHNGNWLMVLDNADDDGIFFSGGNESHERGPLVNFLPQAAHGSILVTSRNGLAARNLVGSDGHVIDVQPMNEEESLALLRARIPAPHLGEDTKALVQALEYIPLAITQAGSYITSGSSRVTVSRYLRLFRENESNQTHLLQHEDAQDLRWDPSIRNAVITTWQLSFEQIRHDRPAATDLLALMSMFDRQGIPEVLVRGDGDGLQFEDALAPLINYSLVRADTKTASFDMHRLVQLSVRIWLEIHLELARWQQKSRAIMAQMFPNRDVDNLGKVLGNQGRYKEAEAMHQRALEAREKVLGHEHPDTLTSVSNLGSVLDSQGRYEEAEAMHQRALEGCEKVLRRDHPDTLTSVSSLGSVLDRQGKYEEAEAMHRRALAGYGEVFGREHPFTLNSFEHLRAALEGQGKYIRGV
ncbi:hypothetical protein N7507_006838 [Penicillium longicatenatum]|nr:hypothetical protein N7507_006838 [Penicillium longicatenatum]